MQCNQDLTAGPARACMRYAIATGAAEAPISCIQVLDLGYMSLQLSGDKVPLIHSCHGAAQEASITDLL